MVRFRAAAADRSPPGAATRQPLPELPPFLPSFPSLPCERAMLCDRHGDGDAVIDVLFEIDGRKS